jgi:50S ribosome-binding GTPase
VATVWSLQTPPTSSGAIAIVALAADSADSLDEALDRLAIKPVPLGRVVLRSLAGIDDGIVARWTPTAAHLMPHAGTAVVRALALALIDAGIAEARPRDPRSEYPEAGSLVEARMLAALARAASPLAIDLLLDQPRRWTGASQPGAAVSGSDRDRVLRRLIDPPLVVALGPPNVGKSTLVNALAGRSVSIVADEPGTTRDHVGVIIDCAGLVVRCADTPGLREDPSDSIEAEAAGIAMRLAADADLVLLCGDAAAAPPQVGALRGSFLRMATRIDLGTPAWPHHAAVCARGRDGRGIESLVALIRDTLVPPAALADPAPWKFWED